MRMRQLIYFKIHAADNSATQTTFSAGETLVEKFMKLNTRLKRSQQIVSLLNFMFSLPICKTVAYAMTFDDFYLKQSEKLRALWCWPVDTIK
jgi:hypothetical protein